jgi:hypothetical protein
MTSRIKPKDEIPQSNGPADSSTYVSHARSTLWRWCSLFAADVSLAVDAVRQSALGAHVDLLTDSDLAILIMNSYAAARSWLWP